jgi:hypothetical protein
VRIEELTPEELLLQIIETDRGLPEVSEALGRALEASQSGDDPAVSPGMPQLTSPSRNRPRRTRMAFSLPAALPAESRKEAE